MNATANTTVTSKASKSVKGALHPDRLANAEEKAANANSTAGQSATGFGREMAKDYAESMGKAASTWARDILKVVTTMKDVQREEVLKGCTAVADEQADSTITQSLKKRITEARRVFKAAMTDYDGTVAILKGKGTWHAKIAAMPTTSNAGRPKGSPGGSVAGKATGQTEAQAPVTGQQASGDASTTVTASQPEGQPAAPVTSIAAAVEQAEKTDSNIPQKHTAANVSDISKAINTLSLANAQKVLDNLLYQLATQKQDAVVADMAKAMLAIKDKVDAAEVKAASAL